MKKRGLTGADVARAAGITESEISRIVSRDMVPTERQALKLREVLDVPVCAAVAGTAQVSA